jgi:hypothetical protein
MRNHCLLFLFSVSKEQGSLQQEMDCEELCQLLVCKLPSLWCALYVLQNHSFAFFSGELWKTNNGVQHCTTYVQISDPSPEGIVTIDQPGQQKQNLQAGLNIASSNVDLMLAQLVMPFTNVLVHVSRFFLKHCSPDTIDIYNAKQ